MRVRIKKGKTHGAFSQYRSGDELDVTVAEFLAFGDKFSEIEEPLDAAVDSSLVDRAEFTARITFDASSMKISEVLRAVSDGSVSTKVALESERSGRARKTLIKRLTEME